MDLGLNGKRALVLGSSQGIGAEIARVLAREGCNVYVGARRLDHIQSLADELSEELQELLLTQSGGVPQAEDPH